MWRVVSTLPCLIMLAGLSACTSPEASRTRASGSGGDVGNRGTVVEIHAGAQPYYHTPCRLPFDCPRVTSTTGNEIQGRLASARHGEP